MQKRKRKEYKHTSEVSHQMSKEESKRRKERKGITKAARKQNGSKHIPIITLDISGLNSPKERVTE